ncbi:MAG: tyrosine-type recombinase/integrase [Oligoflexus sp.]|nr:tyrosine-type recombinase/integrase [Oligoflexus sp.]
MKRKVHTAEFKSKVALEAVKNGSHRYNEMNPDVRRIMSEYSKEDLDFRPFEKIMRSHTIKYFSKLAKKAGVREIHFHAIRHRFLTNIPNGDGIELAVPLLKVKTIAGHRHIETTMIYVHNDRIENITSGLWSREERKEKRQKSLSLVKKEA